MLQKKKGGVVILINVLQKDMNLSTRQKRKSTVKFIIGCLSAIRDEEQRCLNSVPDNFQNTENYETGELAVDALDEIIDLLNDVY